LIGAGGLGAPLGLYLAAAGIGTIGIVDDDMVELSNLQRQILHTESSLGEHKAKSAADSIKRVNSSVQVDIIPTRLTSTNASKILGKYDIILDCTDNGPTRYLLSDMAVVLKKPLVSGAAQKYEGQLAVYNLGPDGPCYRCLFPKPPVQETIGTCEETGILGTVTGIIGNLQALETIKLITGLHDRKPSMLLFSALGSPPFRSIRLRSRKANCTACGRKDFDLRVIADTDYVQACGGPRPDWIERGLARTGCRTTVKDLKQILDSGQHVHLLDVRPSTEFGICQLPSSQSQFLFRNRWGCLHVNPDVPLPEIVASPDEHLPRDAKIPTYVICRLGNDSQIAAEALRTIHPEGNIQDVIGGLRAWSKEIDTKFPVY